MFSYFVLSASTKLTMVLCYLIQDCDFWRSTLHVAVLLLFHCPDTNFLCAELKRNGRELTSVTW